MAKSSGCPGDASRGSQNQKNEAARIDEALKRIGHKIVVLSGKFFADIVTMILEKTVTGNEIKEMKL